MGEARVDYLYEAQGRLVVLRIDGPPVNAFGQSLRRALFDALLRARDDVRVEVVVLVGAGRGFSAGGDIREFGTSAASAEPGLSSHLHVAIEQMGKPVIAVAHGFAMGGGLETLLACHYRIAEGDTRLGFPEVGLGTLPLSARQRLPRLLGILPALRMVVEGEQRRARDFAETSMFDRIVAAGQGLSAARELAAELLSNPPGTAALTQRLVRNRPWPDADLQRSLTDADLWLTLRHPDVVARAAFKAVEASVRSVHFDAGLACARMLFDTLMADERIIRGRDEFLSPRPNSEPLTETDIIDKEWHT